MWMRKCLMIHATLGHLRTECNRILSTKHLYNWYSAAQCNTVLCNPIDGQCMAWNACFIDRLSKQFIIKPMLTRPTNTQQCMNAQDTQLNLCMHHDALWIYYESNLLVAINTPLNLNPSLQSSIGKHLYLYWLMGRPRLWYGTGIGGCCNAVCL